MLWSSICKVAEEIKSVAASLHQPGIAEFFSEELGYRCHASDNQLAVLLVNRSSQPSIVPLEFASGWRGVDVIAGPEPTKLIDGKWQLDCPAHTASIFRFHH